MEDYSHFYDTFWNNDRTWNDRIREINKRSRSKYRLRLETPTTIYCIGISIPQDIPDGRWLLCKIGQTKDDRMARNNRMEQLKAKIAKQRPGEEPDTIFELQVSATDPASDRSIEASILKRFGYKVHKDVITGWGLDVPTEWVITTAEYIDKIRPLTRQVDASTELFDILENTFMGFADKKESGEGRTPLPGHLVLGDDEEIYLKTL